MLVLLYECSVTNTDIGPARNFTEFVSLFIAWKEFERDRWGCTLGIMQSADIIGEETDSKRKQLGHGGIAIYFLAGCGGEVAFAKH
jgi:hypothetical protein